MNALCPLSSCRCGDAPARRSCSAFAWWPRAAACISAVRPAWSCDGRGVCRRRGAGADGRGRRARLGVNVDGGALRKQEPHELRPRLRRRYHEQREPSRRVDRVDVPTVHEPSLERVDVSLADALGKTGGQGGRVEPARRGVGRFAPRRATRRLLRSPLALRIPPRMARAERREGARAAVEGKEEALVAGRVRILDAHRRVAL